MFSGKRTKWITSACLATGLYVVPLYADTDVVAGTDTRTNNSGAILNAMSQEGHAAQQVQFILFEKMQGVTVISANDKTLGSVTDAIVERGSGDIKYLVLSRGDVLGIGGDRTAVPYSAFSPKHNAEGDLQLQLMVTPEQLRRAPLFEPEKFADLRYQSWQDQVNGYFKKTVDAWTDESKDKHQAAVQASTRTEIEGEITNVERISNGLASETVVVTIQPDDGDMAKIQLGPSWYVMTQKHTPVRGQTATVTAYPVAESDYQFIAATTEYDDGSITLRDDKTGHANWLSADANSEEAQQQRTGYRYMLASDLADAEIIVNDGSGGHVDHLIFECRSGQVAFFGVDPDADLLDQEPRRLVPWNAAQINANGALQLSMARTEILNQPAMPKNVDQLNNQDYRDNVYSSWDLDTPKFEPIGYTSWNADNALGGWDSESAYAEAIRNGVEIQVSGEVTEIKNLKPAEHMVSARAVVVQTSEGAITVHLGPAWYIENQSLSITKGETISLTVIKALHDGNIIYAAKTVDADGKTHIFRDKQGEPVWDAS